MWYVGWWLPGSRTTRFVQPFISAFVSRFGATRNCDTRNSECPYCKQITIAISALHQFVLPSEPKVVWSTAYLATAWINWIHALYFLMVAIRVRLHYPWSISKPIVELFLGSTYADLDQFLKSIQLPQYLFSCLKWQMIYYREKTYFKFLMDNHLCYINFLKN